MTANNSKEKVRQLQNKLYLTAKKCNERRFHSLFDKVYREDVLREAWKRVKANKGAAGIDEITIEQISVQGAEDYMKMIGEELRSGKYKPSPVKRVMIPKPDGSERPLGIPTVKDRLVQMATKIAIEPVFEADFQDCSYGFRPKRSAKQALESVKKGLNNKGYYVIDADIEKFFDTVNQEKLMMLVEQRISDRRILKLIRQWLKAGIMTEGTVIENDQGTSQGSVISPLLANVYLNTLDRLWGKYGKKLGKLVRYADDTVIICKNKKNADHAFELLRYIMGKLDLSLNPTKTRITSMWGGGDGFDFLGFHHRKFHKPRKDGKQYIVTYQYPSKKAMKKMKQVTKENVNQRNFLPMSVKYLVDKMNLKIRGWKNYYKTETNDKWMRALDFYILCTFTRWFNKKYKNSRKLSNMTKVKGILRAQGLITFAT